MKTIAKLASAIGGLLIFIIALEVMKDEAEGIGQFMRSHLQVTSAANSMGFGWLMAYVVMSGSPVASATVALLSAGALSVLQAFTMIAGSRMGASSVVLIVGFIHIIARRQERATALAPGVISFLVTASMQAVAVPLGALILSLGWLDEVSLPALSVVAGGLGRLTDPIVSVLSAYLPDLLLFVCGVGLTIVSFRLFDSALPQLHLERTGLGQVPRLVYRPEIMFLMGLIITVITLSVSVSVGMLVPLSTRGYIRRENIVPYILGANVSTFVDTLVAAVLLGDPRAVTIVLTHMICAAVVSLLLVILVFRLYERLLSRTLSFVTRGRRHLVGFLAVILIIPVVLLLV